MLLQDLNRINFCSACRRCYAAHPMINEPHGGDAVRGVRVAVHRAHLVERRQQPVGLLCGQCSVQQLGEVLARRAAIAAFNAANQYVKRGIALTPVKFGISFNTTFLNQAGSLIHVYNDGSVHLNHGGTEMGQGLYTKIAQIVAHEFQIDVGLVKITATTTGKVPNTSATAASSGTDLNGMAAMRAARPRAW